ncbi:hypothetical protein EVAR_50444_1 [Eumeta japonica]|uniref:Uncharacterized protein n=1 Tax=Eumeta variegata TaxID=151549 RepID=A0A4C1XWH5_EUMVA|nr:hypothetical protein EVAR_50444_1 [Eumeta japonica]
MMKLVVLTLCLFAAAAYASPAAFEEEAVPENYPLPLSVPVEGASLPWARRAHAPTACACRCAARAGRAASASTGTPASAGAEVRNLTEKFIKQLLSRVIASSVSWTLSAYTAECTRGGASLPMGAARMHQPVPVAVLRARLAARRLPRQEHLLLLALKFFRFHEKNTHAAFSN